LAVDAPDKALDDRRGDLRFRQPHDGPAAEERLDVFRGVGDETGRAIVAPTAFDEYAALDLEDRFARGVSEVCAPFALRVEDEFTFQFRAAETAPVKGELCFEARTERF